MTNLVSNLWLLTSNLFILGYINNNSACKSPIDKDIGLQNKCGARKFFCRPTRYRSLNGSCNNLKRPEWGSASMPYARLLPNKYSDGIYEFPLSSKGKALPNARAISLKIYPGIEKQDENRTLITMQWGQVVTHDLSLTMGISQTLQDPITCCEDGKVLDPAISDPRCKPIPRPPNDPATLKEGNMCIDFARTLSTKDVNCTSANEPAAPLSAVTSHLDLSLTYGLNDSASYKLREGRGGRLITLRRHGHDWPPQNPNITAACAVTAANEPCYFAGDVRVNQNLQLSLLHVILLREHNRIAGVLKQLNPRWNDETLFQEARRILIACAQKITYYEYLPEILGYENMIKKKLIYPNSKGHVNDYNSSVDPSIYTEFSAAAFRFFHTSVNGGLKKYSEDRKEIGSIRLSAGNVRPSILELHDNFVDLSRGLCTQTENDYDENLTPEITNFFFRLNATFGVDVRAIDIQRSRDFGLSNYNDTRVYCGLSPIYTFEDLKVNISAENVEKLKTLYDDVEDVELLVAGSLEHIVPGTTMGPTFLCILFKQFYNIRVSDRFFFESKYDRRIAFSKAQLRSIHKTSLSRIMCDNTGIKRIQHNVFRVISEDNPLVPCEEIPSLDLRMWKEKI